MYEKSDVVGSRWRASRRARETYATLRNLEHYCKSLGIDPADEEIAVVGIPGSIATAAAALLAPRCRGLILGARR